LPPPLGSIFFLFFSLGADLGPEGLCDARFNSSPAAIVFQLGAVQDLGEYRHASLGPC